MAFCLSIKKRHLFKVKCGVDEVFWLYEYLQFISTRNDSQLLVFQSYSNYSNLFLILGGQWLLHFLLQMQIKGLFYFLNAINSIIVCIFSIMKAIEVLGWRHFSAEDALSLGLIDKILKQDAVDEEIAFFKDAGIHRKPFVYSVFAKALQMQQG